MINCGIIVDAERNSCYPASNLLLFLDCYFNTPSSGGRLQLVACWLTGPGLLSLTVLVATIDVQWEGMGDVGSARYEPALLPPCPAIRVSSCSN